MGTAIRVTNWRAIEALRAGVPNRDAVRALGSSQPAVESRFKEMLSEVRQGFEAGKGVEGVLFAGDFGSGKSHLLEYLQHVALENGFACSKVIISRETPLYDAGRIYDAAIQAAKVPEWSGNILSAIAKNLEFDSPEYADFKQWAFDPSTSPNSRFGASMCIFQQGAGGRYPEISDRILQFWGGVRAPDQEMMVWLKELGEETAFKFDKATNRDLVSQRYEFMSRLIRAAGYAGWILLIDEVELMGRYSLMQRAKSYGEMAKLLGILDQPSIPGLGTVCAITSAYQLEVMDDRRDDERISAKLRSTGDRGDWLLAGQADRGMQKIRQIPQDNMILEESIDLAEIYGDCQNIYYQAYGWLAPSDFKSNGTWRIRQHIKHWINSWDLARLFPEHESELQVTTLEPSYAEGPLEEDEAEVNSCQVTTLEPSYAEGPLEEAEVNSCVVEGARPRFAVFGGQDTYKDRNFAPDRRITQLSGWSIPAVEWRWCVQGFDMPWQWADEQKLRQQPLVWEFDKEEVGVSGSKWTHLEEAQMGIELRFQLNGDWLRELHRFPLTQQQLVDGKNFWRIGQEILPPVTYRDL